MDVAERSITKILSANDTGETGGHQAGVLVPKEKKILSFFPDLGKNRYNPRSHLVFTDKFGAKWEFTFIHYNNRLFGGTRNEYRLTGMTRFFREAGLLTGDEVILSLGPDGRYFVDFRRKSEAKKGETGVLKLGSSWKVIAI